MSMTEAAHDTIEILNELLAAETAGLIARLRTASPFVDWTGTEENEVVGRILRDQARNAEILTQEILRLEGAPEPSLPDTTTADLHYLDLAFLLPKILDSQRKIVDLYQSALAELSGEHLATTRCISDLLAEHRRYLSELEALRSGSSSA